VDEGTGEETRDEARDEAHEETIAAKQRRLFDRGRDTARIEFFSDAVFAIALTLLVLDIRVPDVPQGKLLGAVLDLWPTFLAYGLSFAIIALNWVFHHRKFRAIVVYDTGLICLNFVFLAFVALVPFPTSLLSEYAPDRVAVVLYALEVAILSLLQAAIWEYAGRRKLLAKDIDPKLFAYDQRDGLAPPIVFLLSIPLAILLPDPQWAMWFWVLTWPVSLIVGRLGARARVPVTETEVKE
jgi:uncharacterized membrane protein